MKIKMKNYARHLWLSLLLLVGATAIAVPGLNGTNENSVAKIDDTEYATLESAFAAAPNGETVTLLTDVTLSGNLELVLEGKSVTFDLDGKTLNGRTNLKSGSLTVKNGTVNCEGGQPLNVYGTATAGAENYSVLTVAEDVTVSGAYGVCMFGPTGSAKAGYGAVANIAGTLNGTKGTVFVSGNLGQNIAGDMKNVINITGKVTSTNDAGVALNGNATVNVKRGAEITGNTGIAVKRGVLNVEDGATVHATGAKNLNPDPNNNGTEMTGAAISMTDTYNNYGAMSVNITGGTFKSDNTVALFKEEGTYTNAATYSVSGGTFSSAVPAEFCAEGYKVVENNGTWTVKESYVAQIGTVKYETLESAFAAAQEGNTITLLTNVTLSGNLELALEGKNVTLDLGGKTLNGRTNLKSGNLTVKNGTVNCEGGQPLNVYGTATAGAENYSVLTVTEDVTVSGAYGVCLFGPSYSAKAGYGAVANIAGTLNGTDGTVFVSGNLGNNIAGDMNNVVNITGKVNGNDNAGVALNGNATVNVKSGAEITGNTGIAIKRGVLNVEKGATVHGTGAENLNPDPNNNGTEMTGAAISMTDTYNNYGAMSVNITGGTFTSDNTVALFKEDGTYANAATYAVSGGTFSSAVPAEFCAEGYVPVKISDGKYSVAQGPYVAKIGETKYYSLADAFEAAQDGQTITVLTDIDLPSTIAVNKQVTLDLAGKKIFNTSDLWDKDKVNWSFFSVQANGNLTVTGDGTIDAKENDCYTFDVRNGGILTIKNGTFTGNISSVYLINEENIGVSTCNIEGGRFSIKQLANNVQDDKYRYLLNCHDASYAGNMAKFNVTGGSFVNFNPANNLAEGTETNFCAPGYEAVQNGDVWTVQKAPVAQIEGGAKYETLQAAINACEAGTETTIKLLDNVTDGAGFAIPDGVTNKNIIIDFDGKSYNVTKDAVGSGNTKSQAMHFYSGNTLTLKNGTITSAATSEENKLKMMMQNYCDLTLDGMTIDCSNVNGGTYPDYSGTTYEYWSNKSVPVFNFNTGNATIKNTTITFRDGDNMGLCVDGGTVALGEGTVVNGPVSAVTGTVTITGGKYSGAVTSDQATLKISGGIFTIEPAAEYCAEGFISVDNEDEATKAQYPYTVVNDDEYVFELIDQEVYELNKAKTFKHVTYTRTFNNTNWQSLFVPFDINVEDYADKYEFAKIHMIAFEKDDNGFTSSSKIVVSYTKVTSGTLYANKPYLIKAKSTGKDVFVLENVTLKGCKDIKPIECNTTHADYSIVGSYQPVTATAEKPYMAMAGGTINWYQSRTIKPFRWVIRVSPKADDYARPNIELVEDDDITGISTMFLNNDDIEGFYNVNGVRHDTPVKGINIVRYKNGQTKKVVIK